MGEAGNVNRKARKKKGPDLRGAWYRSRKGLNSNLITTRKGPTFKERVSSIPTMPLSCLPSVIQDAALEENIDSQVGVIEACLQRILQVQSPDSLHRRSPRPEQVRTLRRLIFAKSDTLLIARTGFGKSLIFHAYSVLTRKITIQIIPLSKLGDEQLGDIRKLGCVNPCLVTARSREEDTTLMAKIKAGEYTHVLLGPEQASSKSFRAILKDPRLQARIGLVAIDECHLVEQWKDFRAEFTMLGELRAILRSEVVWFGCSATLTQQAERAVLEKAGFRPLGSHVGQTVVIRTSVDRPDVFLATLPIPKGQDATYKALYFLIQYGSIEGNATPERIPKTIVFIDGRKKVAEAASYLRKSLAQMCEQYSASRTCKATYSTFTVVDTFTSHVSQFDRDARYAEFKEPTSKTRVMVATTSLGMGVNIADVERVVIWRFPLDMDPSEVWQRIGRGGRGAGRTSIAYIFLPYWAFDSQGRDPTMAEVSTTSPTTTQTRGHIATRGRRRKERNALPVSRQRAVKPSRLRTCLTPGDISDTESITSAVDGSDSQVDSQFDSQFDSQVDNQRVGDYDIDVDKPNEWSPDQLIRRAALPDCWKLICNATCNRQPFLTYLGEQELPLGRAVPTPAEQCCNACNPSRLPLRIRAPTVIVAKRPTKPTKGSKGGIALDAITAWALEQAIVMYNSPYRRYPVTANVIMSTELMWQLSSLYTTTAVSLWGAWKWDELISKVPLLETWKYRSKLEGPLLHGLQQISKTIEVLYAEQCRLRKLAKEAAKEAAKEKAKQAEEESQPPRPVNRLLSAETSDIEALARDSALSVEVSRREATRRLLYSVRKGVLLAVDALEDGSAGNVSHKPAVTTEIEAQDGRIRNSLPGPAIPTTRTSPTGLVVPTVPTILTTPTTPSTPTTPKTSNRKRARSASSPPPSRHRQPLALKDHNATVKPLSFSPMSASGRKRTLTKKGSENYQLRA